MNTTLKAIGNTPKLEKKIHPVYSVKCDKKYVSTLNRQTVLNVNYVRSVKNEERAVQLECSLYSLQG